MRNLCKKTLLVLSIFSLSACSTPSTNNTVSDTPNKKFTKYLNELVVEYCEDDFTTMHQYFEDPEKYGIDEDQVEVSLGDFMPEDNDEDDQLDTFDRDTLDKTQQVIYDQLQFENELQEETNQEKYTYSSNIWSSFSGLHEVYIQLFSEYILRDEDDIDDLITLINDVPRYTNEALEYTKTQADKNLLSFDYDNVISSIQETLDTKENSSVLSELEEEIDQLQLENAQAYKTKIKEALDHSFFPSYQSMYDTLTSLKDKVQPLTGLSNYKNGKSYYELLVKEAIGDDTSIEEIKQEASDAIQDSMNSLQVLLYSNTTIANDMYSISSNYTNVEDILIDLQKTYKNKFPEVETMHYDLKALADDQSQEGVVAYFMIPAIDHTDHYQIRYNKRDYGSDPSSVSLYQTLAHEGIPGHMYQTQYNSEHYTYPIQYFLSNNGFTEGWATYVESQLLQEMDTNVSQEVLQAYNLNNVLSNMYIILMDISIHYDGVSYQEFVDLYGDLFGTDLQDLYDQLADNPASFLSYYYGYLEIVNLKDLAKDQLGNQFDSIDFHNALLQYGNVNFNLIEESINDYIEQN